MEIADLPAIAALSHKHDALVAVDATWSADIALPVFKLGAGLSIQALTKYQFGGSDVMMGVVTTADDEVHDKLFQTRTTFGIGVSTEDCYLILRSLPHLKLRYHVQDQSARNIASWFSQQPCRIHRQVHRHPGQCSAAECRLYEIMNQHAYQLASSRLELLALAGANDAGSIRAPGWLRRGIDVLVCLLARLPFGAKAFEMATKNPGRCLLSAIVGLGRASFSNDRNCVRKIFTQKIFTQINFSDIVLM